MRPIWILSLLLNLASGRRLAVTNWSYSPVPRDLSGRILLIDGDNVRGKHDFRWSKRQLFDFVTVWTESFSAEKRRNRVVLFYDHGADKACYCKDDCGVCVIFAGQREKADDVIVQSVKKLTGAGCSVRLVTSDEGLKSRSRRAGEHSKVIVTRSEQFIDQLVKEGCVFTEEMAKLVEQMEPAAKAQKPNETDTEAVTAESEALQQADTIIKGLVGLKTITNKAMRRATGRNKKRKLQRRLAMIEEALREALTQPATALVSKSGEMKSILGMDWLSHHHSPKSDAQPTSTSIALTRYRIPGSCAVSARCLTHALSENDQQRIHAARRATKLARKRETTADREVLAEVFRAEISELGFQLAREAGDVAEESDAWTETPARALGTWLNAPLAEASPVSSGR